MMNSFFQTHMHLADVQLTMVSTPFGLFEWTVMPMELKKLTSDSPMSCYFCVMPLDWQDLPHLS